MITTTQLERIVAQLAHGCDGPVTPFVLMSRATELAARRIHSAEDIAKALYTCMSHEHNYLSRAAYEAEDPAVDMYNCAD